MRVAEHKAVLCSFGFMDVRTSLNLFLLFHFKAHVFCTEFFVKQFVYFSYKVCWELSCECH